MKRILEGGVFIVFLVCGAHARPVSTQVDVVRPTTSVTVDHPSSTTEVFHATTSQEVIYPSTQTDVFHPQTDVAVNHPTTQVSLDRPQTTVEVVRPQTTVEVLQPQTTVEVFHPQTPAEERLETTSRSFSTGAARPGRSVATTSSQVTTSMSDFKPMQAKDFAAKAPQDKASSMGGGSMNLGNSTDQAEKDNVNATSLLGEQAKAAQNIDVDTKKQTLNLGAFDQKIKEATQKAK